MVDLDFSTLMMFRHDRVLSTMRTFRPDPVLYARTGDLDRTWPASVLENSMPASECQPSDVWGLELRWLLWATCSSLRGFRGPPGVGAAVGSEVSPPARFTLPGAHGDSSGGLPGNYSNFLAPSH